MDNYMISTKKYSMNLQLNNPHYFLFAANKL